MLNKLLVMSRIFLYTLEHVWRGSNEVVAFIGSQVVGVCVSYCHLSGNSSEADVRKLECKTNSVEEEKQPVGMFPLGC